MVGTNYIVYPELLFFWGKFLLCYRTFFAPNLNSRGISNLRVLSPLATEGPSVLRNRTHLPTYLPYWAALRVSTELGHTYPLAACLSHAGTWRVVFMFTFLSQNKCGKYEDI